MSFTAIPNEAIDDMNKVSAGAWRLYCFLLRSRNQETGRAFPSIQISAEAVQTHPNNIYRLRKELSAIGWVMFEGDEVKFLLDCRFSKNAKVSVDNIEDIAREADFSKNAKKGASFSKNAKGFSKNAKKFSKNAKTYKEQQDELTTLREQDSGAVAPVGNLDRKECFALFVEIRTTVGQYEVPYRSETKDFVQLAKLLENCSKNNWVLTAEKFSQAARHYFTTPRSTHTLADLAVNFSDFFKHAFDRFGKPVEENSNGRTKVPRNETHNERAAREYEELVLYSAAVNAASDSDQRLNPEDTSTQGITIDITRY